MTRLLQRFRANTTGRDFVVGDIHGHFDLLDRLLAGVGFDGGRDRLFSLGDLVDRGPDSPRALEFLDRPWFFAIRGNHEQMLLDAVDEDGGADPFSNASALWRMNGGNWFFELEPEAQRALRERVGRLPLALEIACSHERLGLVHGELPGEGWVDLEAALATNAPPEARQRWTDVAVWGRSSAYTAMRFLRTGGEAPPPQVAGIDRVGFGHTPMPCPVAAGNTRWLDTGAGHGGPLTLMELDGERLWQAVPGARELRAADWNEPA